MNTTAAMTITQPRKFAFQPLFAILVKIGCAAKRTLDGAAWGAAAGSMAGAMLGMAIFAWSLNTPFSKLFDQTVSALIILVVVTTLGGLSTLALRLLRAGLRWLYTRPQRPLRWIAAGPYFIAWLTPLPLIFAGAGIGLASQLYTWFPRLIAYFFTLQGPVIPIVAIETVLGLLAGIVLTYLPRHAFLRILAFWPAAR